MTKDELEKKHAYHKLFADAWRFYGIVYESGDPLINEVLYQHPRESSANYEMRIKDAYVENFARAVVEIFSFYTFAKEISREIPDMKSLEPLWKLFKNDADLRGMNYNDLINENAKMSSVYGFMGLLVDKPGGARTLKQAIENHIYPYVSAYTPDNIYDWKFKRNQLTHRDELIYLKLYDGNHRYIVWRPDYWSVYQVRLTTSGSPSGIIDTVEQAENELGEIPFVWLTNLKKVNMFPLGDSDIKDISHITASIIQNCSCAEEIIKAAGFPMLREPMAREGEETSDEVPVGPRRVFEFDPTLGPHAKPDFMETQTESALRAIGEWIDRKVNEIYRICHMSGMKGQRTSNAAQSGLALRYEFDMLNTMLNAKVNNVVEADSRIVHYWLKWMGVDSTDITVRRSRQFNLDEMSIYFDNVMTSMNAVLSKTFRVRVQQKMAKTTLPELTPEEIEIINQEIDTNTPDKPSTDPVGRSGVRSALQSRADHS